MTEWANKYLLHIVEVCRDCRNDPLVSPAIRDAFAQTLEIADSAHRDRSDTVELAFSAMCAACKNAGLHQCSGTHSGFHYCRLMLDRLH